jgi:uncharacterized protein (TIGR03437 family)
MYSFFRAPFAALAAMVVSVGALPAASNLVIAGSDGGVYDYLTQGRNFIRSWVVGPSVTKIIPSADGQKVYVISTGASGSITTLKRDFTDRVSPDKSIANLVSARLTPDGTKLVVIAGTSSIRVFKTLDDTEAIPSSPANIATITDTVLSADSKSIYVFTGLTKTLVTVDLTTQQIVKTAQVAAENGTLQRAPNGLLYLATNLALLEIDPLFLVTRASIAFQGLPIRLAFSPDGSTAYTVDPLVTTGASIAAIDLTRHTVAAVSTGGIFFQKLFAASNDRLFGVTGDGHLYSVAPKTSQVIEAHFTDQTSPYTQVTDLVMTEEVPAPQTMYVVRGNRYAEVYLPTSAQVADAGVQGGANINAFAYLRDTQTGIPSKSIAFGANQSIAAGGVASPLGVRILNSASQPLRGISVQFTAQAGASVNPGTVVTDIDGYAYTTVTLPQTAGIFTVTSAASSVQNTFTMTLSSVTPPNGGPTPGAPQVFSGTGQLVFASTLAAEPLIAIVKDANGQPVAGQTVTWAIKSGGANFFNLSATTTGADGKSQAIVGGSPFGSVFSVWELSTITASTPAGSATFYLTTINSLVNSQLLAPAANPRAISGKIGQRLNGAIKVQVSAFAFDPNPPVNIAVEVSTNAPTGQGPTVQCAGSTPWVLTDSTGVATCDLIIGGTPGTAQLTVTVGGTISFGSFPITAAPGDPAVITPVSGNNASGTPAQTITLIGQVADAGGSALIGTPVTWELVTPGRATLSKTSDVSDSAGKVTTVVTLGSAGGPFQVRLRAGSSSVLFNLTINLPVTLTVAKVSGDNQTAELTKQFPNPFVVKVTDSSGNVVPGAGVDFVVTSGVAFTSLPRATTDTSGLASITLTASVVVGPGTLKATSGSSSVIFSFSIQPAGPSITGFFDIASFKPVLTPGALARVTGTNLVPNIVGSIFGGSLVGGLPYSLNGISIDVGGLKAPIYAISNVNNEQSVTFQVPFEATVGDTAITVNTPSGNVTSQQVLQVYAPGLFLQSRPDGVPYAIVMRPDGSFVSPDNPAVLGETLKTFASGLGATSPSVGTNAAGIGGQNVLAQLIVGVNHAGMLVVGAEYAQNLIGVYEITFVLDPKYVNPGKDVAFQIAIRTDTGTINSNDSVLPLVQ